MKIFGNTSKLHKIITDDRLLQKTYGKQRAEKFKQRRVELLDAKDLTQISTVPPPRLHSLHGDREGQFAIDITANFRLVFEAYDKNKEQTVDKTKAVSIVVMGIEDYH
jgi:plasmid maintenance system killer protein